ncbi:UNVERIFIED_CONTAM: hypothetical protein FKN15_032786 [Acipenser sinensis]
MVGFVFDLVKVGIRGKDIVVLGVVKKSVAKQQKERTVRKICALDEHVCMAFAAGSDTHVSPNSAQPSRKLRNCFKLPRSGLTADAGIVINRARVDCQSHRLTVEDPVTVEYITRYIATLNSYGNSTVGDKAKRYTQSNEYRPFGISALIVDFDYNGPPRLYQTDPSGTWKEWVLSGPQIRQQDSCLTITAYSSGSKVTLELCNTKDNRQNWKLKGPSIQHQVSGLCLDSQSGLVAINQCHSELASQKWEIQQVT